MVKQPDLLVGYGGKRNNSSESNRMGEKEKEKARKEVAVPRPSSSVILVSPQNQVLLLHRVKSSSSFASAHVFPGGNLSKNHDGEIPPPESTSRHEDSLAYRLGAIRETFEESGLLLARNGDGKLMEVDEKEREEGRKKVHGNEISFVKWLEERGGKADVDNLIPFTRWVTPANLPKRFTTQMYLYLLPLSSTTTTSTSSTDPDQEETIIPTPTHDGGIEHTAARFLPPATWLRLATSSRLILFPPQYFLLHLISPFLSPNGDEGKNATIASQEVLQKQREDLVKFIKDGKWGDKCISPLVIGGKREDGRVVLGLDRPGLEPKGKTGEFDRVVLVEFKKEGPRRVEVAWRKDVLEESRGKL